MACAHVQGFGPKAHAPAGYHRFSTSGFGRRLDILSEATTMQSATNLDKVTIMSISSMLLAGRSAYYVYDELKKSSSGNNTAKYVASASLTAITAKAA